MPCYIWGLPTFAVSIAIVCNQHPCLAGREQIQTPDPPVPNRNGRGPFVAYEDRPRTDEVVGADASAEVLKLKTPQRLLEREPNPKQGEALPDLRIQGAR